MTTARARGAAEGSSLHSPRPKPHECHQPEPCHGATARTTRNRAAQYGKPAVAGELMRDGAVDGSSATRLVALAWPARGARAARDRERAPRAARYGSCSVREKAARHRLGTGAARYGSSSVRQQPAEDAREKAAAAEAVPARPRQRDGVVTCSSRGCGGELAAGGARYAPGRQATHCGRAGAAAS